VKDFSTIITPLTKIIKNSVGFKWDEEQDKVFNLLKNKLCVASVLALQDFTKAFKVECDASGIGISAMLIQDKSSLHISVRNLIPVYDKELYALMRTLKTW